MNSLEMIFAFTAILFPISLALPSFLTYIMPTTTIRAMKLMAAFFAIPLLDLWATIVFAWILLPKEGWHSWCILVIISGFSVAITITLIYMARYLREWVFYRSIVAPYS